MFQHLCVCYNVDISDSVSVILAYKYIGVLVAESIGDWVYLVVVDEVHNMKKNSAVCTVAETVDKTLCWNAAAMCIVAENIDKNTLLKCD